MAPFVPDWTYGAMCYDHLPLSDTIYMYKMLFQHKMAKKVVSLEAADPTWMETQNLFIEDAKQCIDNKMQKIITRALVY